MWQQWRRIGLVGIAAALLLAAAMAPTLTRLIQHAIPEAAIMAAVCVMPGDTTGTHGSDKGTMGSDCPMCLSFGQGLEPQPSALRVARLPVRSEALPALFLHAPRPLFAWAAAQPRAPPASA